MNSAPSLVDRSCTGCGAPFSPNAHHQQFCSERCRWRYRDRNDPRKILANRERNRLWSARNRGCRKPQPWLKGPPPIGPFLPGGGFALHVSPPPQWEVQLRNTRGLHGMVTQLLGEPHHPNQPGFTLIPLGRGVGWGVFVANEETAARVAGRTVSGVLFDREVTVSCGPLHRVKTPAVTKRGRQRIRIDAITPVCMRTDHSKRTHLYPTQGNLHSTLSAWLPRRLGLDIPEEDVRLELVERQTQPDRVPTGGKYGVTVGWTGHVVLEVNAVAAWLFRCAETIGLGGRTAFGFGRIKVSDGF